AFGRPRGRALVWRIRPGDDSMGSTRLREGADMPIATPEVYAELVDRAKEGGFAYPAVNCTSSQTINAAIRGFAEAESDGIIQVSTGGAEYMSGPTIKDRVRGAIAFA